jgi:large subunit ribosomal protein L24
MSNKLKVKKGDEVVVIAGKDKGKKGKIVKVIPDESRVIVDGVNMIKRHTKPSRTSAGGIVAKASPLHVSNVQLIDPKSGKGTRVGYKTLQDGKKVRVARKSGEVING